MTTDKHRALAAQLARYPVEASDFARPADFTTRHSTEPISSAPRAGCSASLTGSRYSSRRYATPRPRRTRAACSRRARLAAMLTCDEVQLLPALKTAKLPADWTVTP